MEKSRRARYTHEFKLEALRMVGAGQNLDSSLKTKAHVVRAR
jgi:transposase-like protein